MKRHLLFILLLLVALPLQAQSRKVYYSAFSHNDYEHSRPLFDALDRGFNCVEADLWYIDGELYVSHSRPKTLDKERTFEKLYVEPIVNLIKQNRGRVHKHGRKPFVLMIDCKTEGEDMLPRLEQALQPYRDILCRVEDGKYHRSALFVFISGKCPRKTILERGEGYLFIDGVIADVGQGIDSRMMPVVSDNYKKFFKWLGEGEMPQEELERMRDIIKRTHAEGKLFRWWGAPDTPQFKRLFIDEGVDLIGMDNLDILKEVMK